jgi:hypothetical protein
MSQIETMYKYIDHNSGLWNTFCVVHITSVYVTVFAELCFFAFVHANIFHPYSDRRNSIFNTLSEPVNLTMDGRELGDSHSI